MRYAGLTDEPELLTKNIFAKNSDKIAEVWGEN